jgi:hypothetical protein
VLATVKVRSSPCSPCSSEDALRAAPRGSGSPVTSAALHGPQMVSGRKASHHFSPSPPARAEQKAIVASASRPPWRRPSLRWLRISRLTTDFRTTTVPIGDMASRLALTRTHSGPSEFIVDFGHRFRMAQPLDRIGARRHSEILKLCKAARAMPRIANSFTGTTTPCATTLDSDTDRWEGGMACQAARNQDGEGYWASLSQLPATDCRRYNVSRHGNGAPAYRRQTES